MIICSFIKNITILLYYCKGERWAAAQAVAAGAARCGRQHERRAARRGGRAVGGGTRWQMGGRCVGAAVKRGEGAAGGAEEGVGDSGWRCALPDLVARPSLAAPRQAFGRRRRRHRTRWAAARDMEAAAGSNVSAGTSLSVVALAAIAD